MARPKRSVHTCSWRRVEGGVTMGNRSRGASAPSRHLDRLSVACADQSPGCDRPRRSPPRSGRRVRARLGTGESLLDRIEETPQCLLFVFAEPNFALDTADLIEFAPQLVLGQRSLVGGPSISEQSALARKLPAVVVGLVNIRSSRCGDVTISDLQRAHLAHGNRAPQCALATTLSCARCGSGAQPLVSGPRLCSAVPTALEANSTQGASHGTDNKREISLFVLAPSPRRIRRRAVRRESRNGR